MEDSLYFYLEPYVYLKNSNNGLLLVNLLDDKAFIFEDLKSITIGKQLQSSPQKTIQITENDTQIPIIVYAIKNFMGDIVSASTQPLQFYSEINHVSGFDAYMKSIIYSKYDIGRYISNCTIFADMANQDSYDYIKFITGIEQKNKKFDCEFSSNMSAKDLDLYIQQLVAINPDITLNICGINLTLFHHIFSKYQNAPINLIVSLRTLRLYPDILNQIRQKQIRYTLLLDISHDNYDWYINDNLCSINAKVENDTDLDVADKLLEQGHKIKPCPVLTLNNNDFIKSLLSISKDELLDIPNKYRVIKINNLINANFWGHIYLFPKGKVCYSLSRPQFFDLNHLYERYKTDFLNGSFEWTLFRNFSKCKDCIFQYLCPSPDYIEIHLRENNQIECLMSNEKISS